MLTNKVHTDYYFPSRNFDFSLEYVNIVDSARTTLQKGIKADKPATKQDYATQGYVVVVVRHDGLLIAKQKALQAPVFYTWQSLVKVGRSLKVFYSH